MKTLITGPLGRIGLKFINSLTADQFGEARLIGNL